MWRLEFCFGYSLSNDPENKLCLNWDIGVIPFAQKGDTLACNNYTCMTLLNTAYKVLFVENSRRQYQSSFHPGKTTSIPIFALRQKLEKMYEFNVQTKNKERNNTALHNNAWFSDHLSRSHTSLSTLLHSP